MTGDPRALVAAGAVAVLIAAIGIGVVSNDRAAKDAADHGAAPSSQPGTQIPQREVAPPVPESMPRDGVYVAGRQIKTGTYTAEGGSFCYWARLKHTPTGTTSILVSSYDPDRQVVTIVPGDVFQTAGCQGWVMVR